VDVPRGLWTSSNVKRKQRYLQFKAAKLSTEIADAESNEAEINAEVKAIAGRVKQGDPLRKYVNIILLKANLDDGEGGKIIKIIQGITNLTRMRVTGSRL